MTSSRTHHQYDKEGPGGNGRKDKTRETCVSEETPASDFAKGWKNPAPGGRADRTCQGTVDGVHTEKGKKSSNSLNGNEAGLKTGKNGGTYGRQNERKARTNH